MYQFKEFYDWYKMLLETEIGGETIKVCTVYRVWYSVIFYLLCHGSEFLGLLKLLKWPVTSTTDLSTLSWDKHQQKLTHLITMMVRMEEEEDSMKNIK